MIAAMCACTGRCKLPPYTCGGIPHYGQLYNPSPWSPSLYRPQEINPSYQRYFEEALKGQRFNKPRYRVKAGREVIA